MLPWTTCGRWLDCLSGSVIRRNMLLHDSPTKTIGAEHSRCVMQRVRHARKNLTTKQLGGFMIVDSFRSMMEFCIRSSWSELVRKHNDPAIDNDVPLYEYVVIGYELIAEGTSCESTCLRCGCLPTRSAPSLLDGIFRSMQTSQVTFVTEARTFSCSRSPPFRARTIFSACLSF